MTKNRKKLRDRMCAGKVAYVSETDARKAAGALSRQTRSWVQGYRCTFCTCWHIGHPGNPDGVTKKTSDRRGAVVPVGTE